MKRAWAVGVALALGAGCGGRQMLLQPPDGTDADVSQQATIGPVDLSQAPAQLSMTCDNGMGTLALDNPCLVGNNLNGAGLGLNEVECTMTTPSSHGVAWSFLLLLSQIAQSPDAPVTLFPMTPSSVLFDLGGGVFARVSSVTGTLTFTRLDPTKRAFDGRFTGVITWVETSGATFSCSVDGPLWGAPGSFT